MDKLKLVPGEDRAKVVANAATIVSDWLARFEKALSASADGGPLQLEGLFLDDSWLRDSLVFSWDMRSLKGLPRIAEYVQRRQRRQRDAGRRISDLRVSAVPQLRPELKEQGNGMAWLESVFDFDSDVGQGRGIVRLANTAVGEWKAWIVFVALEELKGRPRKLGTNRDLFHVKPTPILYEEGGVEPAVLIVGAGHCGLSLAACLQALGVRALVIERHPRVGDSWRTRYKTLKLHSPGWGDNLPCFEFPATWPLCPDKDMVGDFLETYSRTLELDVWTDTEFRGADYDDASGRWTVRTETTDGTQRQRRTLHPAHLVWAGNGMSFDHPNIPAWPGREEFRGKMYHASQHKDAASVLQSLGEGHQDKKIVLVGSNTAAHDLAMDYLDSGARDVTMVQRGSTIIFSTDSARRFAVPPPPPGFSSDDHTFLKRSFPLEVSTRIFGGLTKVMAANDRELLDAVERNSEFCLDRGETGDSFLNRFSKRRGGFYVNHGGSEAVVEGRIRVLHSPGGVERVTPTGLRLADGREVEADVVVLCTSWRHFETVVGDIVGEDVARRTKEHWGVDEDGELGGIYRPTGHPGFWLASANFGASKAGTPALALQIAAIEAGLNCKGGV